MQSSGTLEGESRANKDSVAAVGAPPPSGHSFGNDDLDAALKKRFEDTPVGAALDFSEVWELLSKEISAQLQSDTHQRGVKLVVPGLGWFARVPQSQVSVLPTMSFLPSNFLTESYRLRARHIPFRLPGTVRTIDFSFRGLAAFLGRSVDEVRRVLQAAVEILAEKGETGRQVSVVLPSLGSFQMDRRLISFQWNLERMSGVSRTATAMSFRPSTSGERDRSGSGRLHAGPPAAAPFVGLDKPPLVPLTHGKANDTKRDSRGDDDAPLAESGSSTLTASMLERLEAIQQHNPENNQLHVPRPQSSCAGSVVRSERPSTSMGMGEGHSKLRSRFAEAKARKFQVEAQLAEMEEHLKQKFVAQRNANALGRPLSSCGSASVGRPGSISMVSPERRAASVLSPSWSVAESASAHSTYRRPSPAATEHVMELAAKRHRDQLNKQLEDEQKIEQSEQRNQQQCLELDRMLVKQKKDRNQVVRSTLQKQMAERSRGSEDIACINKHDLTPFANDTLPERWRIRPSMKHEKARVVREGLDKQISRRTRQMDQERQQRAKQELRDLEESNQAAIHQSMVQREERLRRQKQSREAWEAQIRLNYQ